MENSKTNISLRALNSFGVEASAARYAEFSDAEQLRDLAAVCYFNEKYAGRLFKAQTGQSFHQYLAAYRLDRAGEMLREGSRAVADVARDCGFESTSYFNRLFRERFGRSPGAYRKETGFSSENLV